MKIKFNNSTIQQFNDRGFTLLELIIVFTVIAILSTVGIASFVSYSRSQSLQSAASDLALTLDSAKSRANSQVKPSGCSGALKGYKIDIYSETTYSLSVVCPGVDSPIQTTILPDKGNIKFTVGVGTSIFFPVITGTAQGAGQIVLTGYNQSRWVCVNPGGIVKILSSSCPN